MAPKNVSGAAIGAAPNTTKLGDRAPRLRSLQRARHQPLQFRPTELRQQFPNCAKLRSRRRSVWIEFRMKGSTDDSHFRRLCRCRAGAADQSNCVRCCSVRRRGVSRDGKCKTLNIIQFMREQAASTRAARPGIVAPAQLPRCIASPHNVRRRGESRPRYRQWRPHHLRRGRHPLFRTWRAMNTKQSTA